MFFRTLTAVLFIQQSFLSIICWVEGPSYGYSCVSASEDMSYKIMKHLRYKTLNHNYNSPQWLENCIFSNQTVFSILAQTQPSGKDSKYLVEKISCYCMSKTVQSHLHSPLGELLVYVCLNSFKQPRFIKNTHSTCPEAEAFCQWRFS